MQAAAGEPPQETAGAWRTDQIEPTYALDGAYAWLLGGIYEIEAQTPTPIVAWKIFDQFKPKAGRAPIATYQLDEHGPGHPTVWRPLSSTLQGHVPMRAVGPAVRRRYFDVNEFPPHPEADATLLELYTAAQARGRAERDADAERRRSDPLIDVLEQIKDRADHEGDVEPLRALVAAQSPADTAELLVRLALDFDELALQLYELENPDLD